MSASRRLSARVICPALFALAMLLSAPLSAQGSAAAAQEPQEVLPADMSPDQLIQFFTNFSETEEMDAALSPEIEAMMTRGAPVAGWQTQGIDILAELGALPGGARANLLRGLDDEVLGVTDLSGTQHPDLAGFESYALRPEPVGLVAERSFSSFLPGIWFEAAAQRRADRNALCYGGYFGITLHTRRPYTRWTQDELLATATLFALFDRMAARDFCLVYDRAERGDGYTTRAFTPDGAPLILLNAQMETSVLMPRDDLSEFLARVPATGTDD